MAKTSQKRSDEFSGTAWAVRRTPDGYQVLQLHLRDGEVYAILPVGEPNLKEIAPPTIEGLVADHLVGGSVA